MHIEAKFPLNVSVMIGLYIYVSEMSIVGPPPDTGWRFFFAQIYGWLAEKHRQEQKNALDSSRALYSRRNTTLVYAYSLIPG